MRARIRFSKFGSMKFLGHLDVMRYFQKALRRTGLGVVYSEGFHPHQIMSFAQPLSLAMTSDGEYFDVEFTEDYPAKEVLSRLQSVMAEEFAVTHVTRLDDYVPNTKKVTCMALIQSAAYCVVPREGSTITEEHVRALAATQELMILRKTKTKEKEYNLSDGIRGAWLIKGDAAAPECLRKGPSELSEEDLFGKGLLHLPELPKGFAACFYVDAGSDQNVSAELLAKGLCQLAGEEFQLAHFYLHRMELYGEQEGKVIPIWQIVL